MPKTARLEGRRRSIREVVDRFEQDDFGDALATMAPAHFDVTLRKRVHLIPVEGGLARRLATLAHARRTSVSRLVDAWLRDRVRQQA